jgi:outer membrane protein assembly factor BamA
MRINAAIAIYLTCFFIQTITAQNKNGMIHIPDTVSYPYVKIAAVVIRGNKLTKNNIIIRELDFKIGDSLATFKKGKRFNFSDRAFYPGDSSELQLRMNYSRENIINTKLFLTVDLLLEHIDTNQYRLSIAVTERHYWWLFPVVKLNAPNFNEWLRHIIWSDLSLGLFFSHNNLWGLSHQFSVAGYAGESYAFGLGYKIPWIGKGQKIGLTLSAGYANLYTVEYGSAGNKRQMLYAPNSEQDVRVTAKLTFRPGLYHYGTVHLTSEWITISDSLYRLDSNYLAGQKKVNTTLNLYADYYYDNRNSQTYPLKGNMLRVFIHKLGLGIIAKDVDMFYYGIDFHFYQALSRKWYIAEMVKAENSAGEHYPYYYQLNMMYKKDFIRGYDLYTLKGDQMYYLRSNIKYELIKPGIKKVKEGQEHSKFKALQYAFYINAFADAGYVVNHFTQGNPLCNMMLYSWGLGIDFVSYYDLVLRFEYAFTSIGTNGFFIGFGMPI